MERKLRNIFFTEKQAILLGILCLLSAIISNSVLFTHSSFAVDPTLTASLDKENLDFDFSGSDLINEVFSQ